jgi:hypothetical protein
MTNHVRHGIGQDDGASDHVSQRPACFGERTHGEHMWRGSEMHSASTFGHQTHVTFGWYDDDIEGERGSSET